MCDNIDYEISKRIEMPNLIMMRDQMMMRRMDNSAIKPTEWKESQSHVKAAGGSCKSSGF